MNAPVSGTAPEPNFAGLPYDRQNWAGDPAAREQQATGTVTDVMHLMTIEMGAWCGASGPGNGRASSQWRDVTCPECTAKGMTWLRALVWDMLQVLPASREALGYALRAGRLGVTGEQGRPLAMACAAGDDPGGGRHPDECPCQFCDEDRREAVAQDYDPVAPAFIPGAAHDPQRGDW